MLKKRSRHLSLTTECTILTTTLHEDLLSPSIYILALCMYVYAYLRSAYVYSHPWSAYTQFLPWLTVLLFQEYRNMEVQQIMYCTRFLEEETHQNSYDMCTLPNLSKMNLFQQQRW